MFHTSNILVFYHHLAIQFYLNSINLNPHVPSFIQIQKNKKQKTISVTLLLRFSLYFTFYLVFTMGNAKLENASIN